MGFRKQAKVFKLRFVDDEYAGLEVRARSVPLGKFLDLTTLAELQGQGGMLNPGQLGQVRGLFEGFASALVSWNLESESGDPVPATLDGLLSQEFDFVLQIIMAWMEAVAGVAAPLAKSSNDGMMTQEGSLPMVPLTSSPTV